MPESKKFKEMKDEMIKEYGKKEGTRIAHATAEKKGWKH